MPRHVTKTYSRQRHAPANSRAFDDIIHEPMKVTASQAASTIRRWGETSFTSKRSAPLMLESEVPRKRRYEDNSEDFEDNQSGSGGDSTSLFDDPFSFDSDDDGPTKPKKGMGFKMKEQKPAKPPAAKITTYRILSTKNSLNKDSTKAETVKKAARGKTYGSHVGKTTLPKAASATLPARAAASQVDSKQLTLDSFTLKFTKKSTLPMSISGTFVNAVPVSPKKEEKKMEDQEEKKMEDQEEEEEEEEDLETRWARVVASDKNSSTNFSSNSSKGPQKKFFTSKNPLPSSPDDHTYSSSADCDAISISSDDAAAPRSSQDHNYFSSQDASHSTSSNSGSSKRDDKVWESDPDSDWDKDSGDPEIVFNSPSKKERLRGRRSPPATDSSQGDNTKSDLRQESKQALQSIRLQGKGAKPKAPSGEKAGVSNGLRRLPSLKKIELREEPRAPAKKAEEPVVRRLLLSSPKNKVQRAKASYNPRQWHDDTDLPPAAAAEGSSAPAAKAAADVFGDFDEADPVPAAQLRRPPILRRARTAPAARSPWDDDVQPHTKVKVPKESKPLFTVVRNVKQAHECLEHGETQEFQDDIEYIMPGMRDSQPVPTRCLSTMSLATKCNVPAFRMHLRAHGIITELLAVLHDAAQHPPLALCVAALLFMNSRDRLVMDLERPALSLMVQLLSADSSCANRKHGASSDASSQQELEKMRSKVSGILETFRKEGNVKDFALEEISTGFLAMETLLSLTSKKAGDWFKEELRTLGGLDHIVNTVTNCVDDFDEFSVDPSPFMLDRCRKLIRCLRVLENVTYLNSDNQTYLLNYKSAIVIRSLYRAIKACENCLPFNEVGTVGDKLDESCPGFVLYSCLLANLRVMLNITNENMVGATKVGQMDGFIRTLLSCIFRLPQFVPQNHRFDLLVLGLGLLINLVEHCDHNQRTLLNTTTSTPFEHSVKRKVDPLEALALLFKVRVEAAKKFEEEHDRQLEEKKRRKEELRSQRGSPQKPPGGAHNKSGQWKESDSGLEWVMNPEEEKTNEDDSMNDSTEVSVPSSQEEEEDFTKALHKAGEHMEDSIVAAYVGLLVGCLIQHSSELAEKARDSLPDNSFDSMVRMLKKFLGFMNFTSATTNNTGSKSIMRVIEILEANNC